MGNFPTVLFVPVSSPEGIGEYMRSLILADAVQQEWPQARIHFALSKQAPYAATCPYPATLLSASPTKEVIAVNALIRDIQPDLVLFDAAGRKSHLQQAHDSGAKVIFISQHKRKRSRGMKLGRVRVTDSHWVVQPEFVIGAISLFDRVKLKLLNKPEPIFIGPVFAKPDLVHQAELLQRFELQANNFVIFNSGSGGHLLGGQYAADLFANAASAGYRSSGLKSVMIYGPNYPHSLTEQEGVIAVPSLSNREFISLLSCARGAVLSGGDSLMQAIALKVPTLSVPVSKDQPARIRACAKQGVVLTSEAVLEDIIASYEQLIDQQVRQVLHGKLISNADMNGLELGMSEIRRLLEEYQCERG